MLPHTGAWSVNEVILASGQATADNLAAQMAEVVYAIRASSRDMLNRVMAVLDRNADSAAAAAHCTVRKHWVSKSRPGLANHAMAEVTYRNLVAAGAPRWEGKAITCAQALQKELGLEPMARPFLEETEQLITPQDAERKLRADIPAWQTHYTSDDYTDMSWHAPTARFYIGRPALAAPAGFAYPDWVLNALGGIPETIDPTIRSAAKTIAGTILDLMTDAETLAAARTEFNERTGGGVGGSNWEKPWCDYPPPIEFPWPRYFETPGGREWWIPETEDDRKLRRT